MALNIWNLQWLNHNSQRSYPVAEWASKQCSLDSGIKLPDDFLLAVSMSVHTGHQVNVDGFFIKSVTVIPSGCSIVIGYYNGSSSVDAAITHVTSLSEQTSYALTGLGDFDDTTGYVAINPKSQLLQSAGGYYTFTHSATALEPDCIRPMLRGISSFQVSSNGFLSDKIYGDIILKAGTNMSLQVTQSANDVTTITFNAIDSSGFSETCPCEIDETMTPVTSINGVIADEHGNINVSGTECVSITTSGNIVNVADTCAQPCCGCAELNALTEEIAKFESGRQTLENFISRLGTVVEQLQISALNTKLRRENGLPIDYTSLHVTGGE